MVQQLSAPLPRASNGWRCNLRSDSWYLVQKSPDFGGMAHANAGEVTGIIF